MKLEIIACNLEDIIKINESSADRIEFCKELRKGGFTPNYNDIQKGCEISNLPVNVMVRNTDRDFCYSDEEIDHMIKDIEFINNTKASGVVFGVLTKDNEIDLEKMKKLISKVKNKTITFHKAFDQVKDKQKALSILEDLGIDTILTGGGENINENIDVIASLKNKTKIKILAGGGVNEINLKNLVVVSDEIHVGTAVRKNNNWDSEIDIMKISTFKKENK